MQDEVTVTQADRNAAVRLLEQGGQDWQAKEIRLGQGDHFPIVHALARHRHQAEREEEEAYKIGISEGRQEMVREIDLATGGDGEFRWSTEPDRHCPCEEAMKARVIERFHQAERETLARMEWRDIESAPKDGTTIDVWRDGIRETVYWGFPPHCCGEMGQYCDSDWHSIKQPGWVCATFGEFVGGKHDPFTHWMPLPPAPEAGQ